jgi:hypothetical protein
MSTEKKLSDPSKPFDYELDKDPQLGNPNKSETWRARRRRKASAAWQSDHPVEVFDFDTGNAIETPSAGVRSKGETTLSRFIGYSGSILVGYSVSDVAPSFYNALVQTLHHPMSMLHELGDMWQQPSMKSVFTGVVGAYAIASHYSLEKSTMQARALPSLEQEDGE